MTPMCLADPATTIAAAGQLAAMFVLAVTVAALWIAKRRT